MSKTNQKESECFEGISREELIEELVRCHERLEIAYCYRWDSDDDSDEKIFNLPKSYLSFDERKTFPDLIECMSIEVKVLESDLKRIKDGAIKMAQHIAQSDNPEEIRKIYNDFVKKSEEEF